MKESASTGDKIVEYNFIHNCKRSAVELWARNRKPIPPRGLNYKLSIPALPSTHFTSVLTVLAVLEACQSLWVL